MYIYIKLYLILLYRFIYSMFKVNTDSYIVYYRNIKSINLYLFSSVISEYI